MKDLSENHASYPGSDATTKDILDLAEAYYDAANELFATAKKGMPLTYAPARLCSIHSIELFQNAFLRHNGSSPEAVRGRLHNLADDTFVETLMLRKKLPSI